MKTFRDRVQGALLGAFIGDALGLGPHWYYDLEAQERDYGAWIDDYTDPLPDRYHAGLKAGDLSQAGIILRLTTHSLVANNGYNEADFCQRMDEEIFARVDGTPHQGPGGYTSQSIREAYQKRIEKGLPWGQIAGFADTTEAIERTLAIAIRYAGSPGDIAIHSSKNAALTQKDETVLALTVAYNSVLGMLIEGQPLNGAIGGKLLALVKSGKLPFHAGPGKLAQTPLGDPNPPRAGHFASPDALLSPAFMAEAAHDPHIKIEPAARVSIVYGMPCAIYHQLPAAYYLAARFSGDFERAVLHAINGGGQNQSRAILTGALAGAQTGRSGIPQRFIDGLSDREELLDLAERLSKSNE